MTMRLAAGLTLLLLGAAAQPTNAQNSPRGVDPQRDRFQQTGMEARGVRLHYLAFGGSGLPVIFIHGRPRQHR